MLSKIKKYLQKDDAVIPKREQISELGDLLAQLAWIETRDAVITINEIEIRVTLFGTINGRRVRLAEGVADNLTDAIKDTAAILRAQEGM